MSIFLVLITLPDWAAINQVDKVHTDVDIAIGSAWTQAARRLVDNDGLDFFRLGFVIGAHSEVIHTIVNCTPGSDLVLDDQSRGIVRLFINASANQWETALPAMSNSVEARPFANFIHAALIKHAPDSVKELKKRGTGDGQWLIVKL